MVRVIAIPVCVIAIHAIHAMQFLAFVSKTRATRVIQREVFAHASAARCNVFAGAHSLDTRATFAIAEITAAASRLLANVNAMRGTVVLRAIKLFSLNLTATLEQVTVNGMRH